MRGQLEGLDRGTRQRLVGKSPGPQRAVVFAAADPKTGVAGSVIDLFGQPLLNHHTRIEGGLMAEASAQLLRDFFAERREAARARRARNAESSQGLIPTGEATELDES